MGYVSLSILHVSVPRGHLTTTSSTLTEEINGETDLHDNLGFKEGIRLFSNFKWVITRFFNFRGHLPIYLKINLKRKLKKRYKIFYVDHTTHE